MKNFTKFLSLLFSILTLIILLVSQTVFAYTSSSFNAIYNGYSWYDPNITSCGNSGLANITISSGNTAQASAEQDANAKIIIGIAKTDKLGKAGATIGVMTALAESSLLDRANTGIPLSTQSQYAQGAGNNYDSLGLFQQRISAGWSTPKLSGPSPPNTALDDNFDNQHPNAINQIMDPAYQAERFFHRYEGVVQTYNFTGLLSNPTNYGQVIQKIQGSAVSSGSQYQAQLNQAINIINSLYASSNPIALPVNLSNVSTSGVGVNTSYLSNLNCNNINSGNGIISKNIVQTAINLSWPNSKQGTKPTASYQTALKQYNPSGYSLTNGLGDDCGVFVATVMHATGIDPNYPSSDTVAQAQYVISHPTLYKVTYPITSTSQLQPGDILIINKGTTEKNGVIIPGQAGTGAGGHTFIYLGSQNNGNNIAQASLGTLSASLGVAQLNDPLGRGNYLAAQYIGPNS